MNWEIWEYKIKMLATLEEIKSGLSNNNYRLRLDAINAAGMLREKELIDSLIPLILVGDDRTRYYVIRALCDMKDKRAMDTFILALKDVQPYIRNAAAFGLSYFKDDRTFDILFDFLNSWYYSIDKEPPLYVLKRYNNEKSKELLLRLCANDDKEIRKRACEVLATYNDETVIETIINATSDIHPRQKLNLLFTFANYKNPLVIEKPSIRYCIYSGYIQG
jgi:HEAT repeat protein